VAAEAITRFGGEVVRYVGDGIMAFFGYPAAHDNDAERAARAGLAILDAIARLDEQPAHPKLAVRIGIDSGRVVVGAGADQAVDAFGDTANIAARVQAATAADTVVVTGETHRLISGLFIVDELGAQTLKGIERPIQLYRIVRPSGMRGRLAAAAATRALTHFVGREDELRLLQSRWERVVEGEGQVITIVGEAGIGKSRLVQEFRDRIVAERHTWLECATAAFFQNTPFYAFADMLQQTFHWHSNQNNERRLAALDASLAATGIEIDEGVPLIAALLGLPLGDKYPPLRMPPDQQRKRLLATLVAWTIGFAKAQPLVLATEDLHWADPSTLEVTQLLVEQGATAPLMLLYTARPEFRGQWSSRAHHTQITLNRLTARNVRTMVAQVAAKIALSDETVATVVARTGGVPLFVEELTRAVLESGDAKLTGREIPATLHDSLMARLDRLGPAKEVIQVGAVIGSDFSYELLRVVHPIGEAELQAALRSLGDAELLYVRGIAPDATYLFKHALIRDAAYEALLKSRRRELHRQVACTINEKFPALREAHPEVLARHWTEAGEIEPAIGEWSRAGKAAEARNAFKEAQESYQQALALLNLLPESPERDLRELDLIQAVVRMLFITRGYSDPQTIEAAEHAVTLATKSGNLRQLLNLIIARGISAVVSGDLSVGSKLADRALELAGRERSPSILGRVHLLQMMACHYRGDLIGAEKHFGAGLEFFDHPSFRRIPGVAVAAFNYGSANAWMLGLADVASTRMARMMAAANENNPYELAFSGNFAAQLQIWMREYERAEVSAAHLLKLSEKHQFVPIAARLRCVLGMARVQLGRTADGIALIRQGIAEMLEAGEPTYRTDALYLAKAQERDGAILDALETVEQALQASPDELVNRPEIFRLRGELRLEQGQTELAEADFREAIGLAQKMGAKAWELRATMSLARLLLDIGRRGEGRAMLAEIYGWFTEGFDTADLKDAKALLEELSG
jgi:tetratricopeptide (TPR) repeat protein